MYADPATQRFVEPLESRRLFAATYYVSPTGNDAADGRSPETAWRSIARVNGKNWNPGDVVRFQAGKTFYATGNAGPNVLTNASFEGGGGGGLAGWTETLGTSAANSTAS